MTGAVAAAFLVAFAAGSWLLLVQRHPYREMKKMPPLAFASYASTFVTVALSMIILGSRLLHLLGASQNGSQ
jgi:hypothetical protein